MEIILLERVEKLGQIGDVVNVKPGYARNFLLPQKKALRANKGNLAYFESQRSQIEAENLELRKEAETISGRLEGFSVVVIRQAGDSGQLYGSVSARDIVDAMGDEAVNVNRTQIKLERPIKTLGIHEVRVQLHPEVAVMIGLNVARSEDEAVRQAESGRMVTGADEEEIEAELEAAQAAADEAAAEAEAQAEDASNDEAGDDGESAAEASEDDETENK